MGVRGQDMGPEIRPVDENMVLVGYAATMLMADQYDYGKDTFKLQFQAIDALNDGGGKGHREGRPMGRATEHGGEVQGR